MLRGFYTAASGMINQQRTLDTISNNLANINTAGFKSDATHMTTFDRELILVANRTALSGSLSNLYTDATYSNLTQGAFETTQSPLDIALAGPVYFNIQAADGGEYLTRNGQFTIDDEGYLALGGAGRVLGRDGQPIQLGTDDFTVAEDGTIATGDGRDFALGLTYVPEDADLAKYRDNLFTAEGAGAIPEGTEYTVLQGAYERSNVDAAEQMTRAIRAQRSYEACSQALKLLDGINERTATELARL